MDRHAMDGTASAVLAPVTPVGHACRGIWAKLWGAAAALALGGAAPVWAQGHGAAHAPMAAAAAAASVPVAPASAKPPAARRPPLATGAAMSSDGRLWVARLDEKARLVLQHSTDLGGHWSEPQVLDTAGDVVAADGEQRPKLAFGPKGLVVVAYTRPLDKPYTGEIRLLRSTDGGLHFGAPRTVHADRQVITHRFESIGFDARGRLHVVWIDKRDGEAARAASPDGKGAYRGAGIYHAVSEDGGATFGGDLRLAEHSCECCRIAVAPTADGSLAAMWRHVFEPNLRDHGFARLDTTTAVEPVRASYDQWALNACPHHGPGLALATDGGYHAVWYGLRDGVPGVRYGRLTARGEPQGEVRVLPDTTAEHADVVADGRRVAIVWRSFDGQEMRLRAWLSDDEGRSFRLQELGRTRGESDHPRLVAQGRTPLAVWRTQNEGVRVVALQP